MKIEKMNENQIRCTLTKQDLADRQINLREFAYGSEKAKGLFHDMIQQANYEFGFEANDIPLMVEAIPLSSESLILVITKVEYPEEVDTRFSRFSEPDEDVLADGWPNSSGTGELKGADDVLGLFNRIREEQEKLQKMKEQQGQDSEESEQERPVPEVLEDLTKMFEFSDMDQVERLARVLDGYYDGQNDLYKNVRTNRFYLMIKKSAHTPEEFNKVCNMMSEFAVQRHYTRAAGAYYAEHGKRILSGNALQVLAGL